MKKFVFNNQSLISVSKVYFNDKILIYILEIYFLYNFNLDFKSLFLSIKVWIRVQKFIFNDRSLILKGKVYFDDQILVWIL